MPEQLELAVRENRRLRRELKISQERCERVEGEISQILHDGVCQELSAVAFYLQSLRNQLIRKKEDRVPTLLEQLSASVQKAVDSAHGLSRRLKKP